MTKILLLVSVLTILASCVLNHELHKAVIVSKVYSPSSVSTGVGPAMGGKSGGIAVVTTSTPEKFILLLKDDTGRVFSHEVTVDAWMSYAEGQSLTLDYGTGRHTGIHWTTTIK